MCKVLGIELNKIRKSKLHLLSFIVIFLSIIMLFSIFTYSDSNMNIFKFFFKVFSGLNYFPFLIPAIVFISMLFAKELEDRTMIYVFIRPIKHHKLFFGKVLAAFILSALMVIVYFIITFIYSFFIFDISSFPFDNSISSSIIRCLVYLVYTFIALLTYIGFCSLISVLVRNMIGSCIISIILGVFSNLITIKINLFNINYRLPMSTLLSPASYYDIDFNSFLLRCAKVSGLNIFVIFCLIAIAYNRYVMIRKGIKSI